MIFDRAWEMHRATCEPFDVWIRDPELASPFDTPYEMPPHEWLVSWDVMQELTEAAPPPQPVPNPKTSDGLTKLLFGWPITVDKNAPAGSMRLLRIGANKP